MENDAEPVSVGSEQLAVSTSSDHPPRSHTFTRDQEIDKTRLQSADKRGRTWVRDPENAATNRSEELFSPLSRTASPEPLSTTDDKDKLNSDTLNPHVNLIERPKSSDFRYTDYKRTLLLSSTGIRTRPITPLVIDPDPSEQPDLQEGEKPSSVTDDTNPTSVTGDTNSVPSETGDNPNKQEEKFVFGPESTDPSVSDPNNQSLNDRENKDIQDQKSPNGISDSNHDRKKGAEPSQSADRQNNNPVNQADREPSALERLATNNKDSANQNPNQPTNDTSASNNPPTQLKTDQENGNPVQTDHKISKPDQKTVDTTSSSGNPNVIVTGPGDLTGLIVEGTRVPEKGTPRISNKQSQGDPIQQTTEANNPASSAEPANHNPSSHDDRPIKPAKQGPVSADERPIRPAKQSVVSPDDRPIKPTNKNKTAFYVDIGDSNVKGEKGNKRKPSRNPAPKQTSVSKSNQKTSPKEEYMHTDGGPGNKTKKEKSDKKPTNKANSRTASTSNSKQPRVYPKHIHVDRGRDVAGTRRRESLRSRSRTPTSRSPVTWSDENPKTPLSASDSPGWTSRGEDNYPEERYPNKNRQSRSRERRDRFTDRKDSPDSEVKNNYYKGANAQKRPNRQNKHVEFQDSDNKKKRRVSLHNSLDIATQTPIAITDFDALFYPQVDDKGGKILYPSPRKISPERYPSDSILTDRPYNSRSNPYKRMASNNTGSNISPRDAWPDNKTSNMTSPRSKSRNDQTGEVSNMASDLMERIRNLEDENKTLGSENQSLREEKEDLLQKFHAAKRDSDQLRKKLYDANVEKSERIRDVEAERDSIKIKLDDEAAHLRMENRNLSEKVDYLESVNRREVSDRKDDKSMLENMVERLQEENEELRADLSKSRSETLHTLKDLDSARKEIVRVIKPSEELKKEIERLEHELKATREESLRTLRELDAVRKIHDKTEAENDRLAVQFSMLETDMEKIIRESKAAKAETAQKNADIVGLKQKLETLDAHFRNSNDLVREKDTIIESLTREIHDLKQSNGTLLKDLSVAQGDKMTLQVVDSQYQDIQNAHKKLLEENKRLQASVLRKNVDNTGRIYETEDMRKKLQDSTNKLENANRRIKMLEEWMDDIYNAEEPEPAPAQMPTYRSDYSHRMETPSPLPELVRLNEPKSSLDNMVKRYTLRNLEGKRRYKKYGMINH